MGNFPDPLVKLVWEIHLSNCRVIWNWIPLRHQTLGHNSRLLGRMPHPMIETSPDQQCPRSEKIDYRNLVEKKKVLCTQICARIEIIFIRRHLSSFNPTSLYFTGDRESITCSYFAILFWVCHTYLHSNYSVIHHDFFGQEISTYGCFVLVWKLPIYILVHQRCFAYTGVSKDDHFQQSFVSGCHYAIRKTGQNMYIRQKMLNYKNCKVKYNKRDYFSTQEDKTEASCIIIGD